MTKISWVQDGKGNQGFTWNPLVGCTRASAGCDRCYAFTMTKRLEAMGQKDYTGLAGNGHFNGVVRTLPHKLDVPMRRKKPTTYFVNSMSDLFHKEVPEDFIDQVFAVMASCPQHTFQVLTKRPERMAEYINDPWRLDKIYAQWYSVNDQTPCAEAWPLPNVWLGTSVENQEQADERIPHLLQVPARVRFLSCEPLLGPVDFGVDSSLSVACAGIGGTLYPIEQLQWIIAGAESGHGARPMGLDWVRSIRDQCQSADVPFFFKQMIVDGKKVELPELDGKVWAQMPTSEVQS